MKKNKKFLISVLSSVGILVVGVGVAYAAFTFKANQEGFRQGGDGQATRLTMRVEAGMADANSDLIPDDPNVSSSSNRGGALSFSIENTSNVPLRVTKLELATQACGTGTCPGVTSNKNNDGTFATVLGSGSCSQWVSFNSPISFEAWPTIGPHSTLQVNGTDNNRLGAGMIHLNSNTGQGCQGATFALTLNVTAIEFTQPAGGFALP